MWMAGTMGGRTELNHTSMWPIWVEHRNEGSRAKKKKKNQGAQSHLRHGSATNLTMVDKLFSFHRKLYWEPNEYLKHQNFFFQSTVNWRKLVWMFCVFSDVLLIVLIQETLTRIQGYFILKVGRSIKMGRSYDSVLYQTIYHCRHLEPNPTGTLGERM